jgi:hypothetical protein
MESRKCLWVTVALCAAFTFGSEAQAGLIQDGGFETPVVGPGGFQSGNQQFGVGSQFGDGNVWSVVGSNQSNVAVYPNTETVGAPPTALNVAEGGQALDLTGGFDNGAAIGVSQSFATISGGSYTLSFDLGAFEGSSASVAVDLDGQLFQTADYTPGGSGFATAWLPFTFTFTAAGDSSTLAFLNNSPNGISLVGLDAVSVDAVSSAPEPATRGMLLAAFAFFCVATGLRPLKRLTRSIN